MNNRFGPNNRNHWMGDAGLGRIRGDNNPGRIVPR